MAGRGSLEKRLVPALLSDACLSRLSATTRRRAQFAMGTAGESSESQFMGIESGGLILFLSSLFFPVLPLLSAIQ